MHNNDKILDLVVKAKEDIASLRTKVASNEDAIDSIEKRLDVISDDLDTLDDTLQRNQAVDAKDKEHNKNAKSLIWEVISSIVFPILVTLIAKFLNL